jgi:dTDP-4-amino-4,6-dideoxygalactose transaminase
MNVHPTISQRLVNFSEPDLGVAEEEAVVRVLRSGWITTGDVSATFESELRDYLGCPYVATLSSCTTAMEAVLAYLQLPPGSTVAVPTWTFVATGLVPARLGLRPALVDVDATTLNISAESLRELMRSPARPRAVMPVLFAGVPVDDSIYEICEREGIPIVGDAAHAFGASDRAGLVAGHRSAADCFSFYATKNLTCAEGGAVATSDADLVGFVMQYRLHGLDRDAWRRHRVDSTVDYGLRLAGTKGNMPDVLAAIGRVQLRRFDAMQRRRGELVRGYLSELSGVNGLSPLSSMAAPGSAHHLFVIVLDPSVDRSRVRRRLAEAGVGTSVHFPPLHEYKWFAEHAVIPAAGLPVASSLARRVMSLPLHPRMSHEDIVHVCDTLRIALHQEGL